MDGLLDNCTHSVDVVYIAFYAYVAIRDNLVGANVAAIVGTIW